MNTESTSTIQSREQLLIDRAPYSIQHQVLTGGLPMGVFTPRIQAMESADAFDPLLLACFARYAGAICQAIYSSVG